jgi:hypothetical protein
VAGATGFEPAIFGLTGRHVNHYTTPPSTWHTIPQHSPVVKSSGDFCLPVSHPEENEIARLTKLVRYFWRETVTYKDRGMDDLYLAGTT